MATVEHDPLLLLRQSIASGRSIIPTTSADVSGSAEEATLSQATHLQFTDPTRIAVPIDAPTRFITNDVAVDLRSIYFAWLNREVAIPEYNNSATTLNEELGGGDKIHKLAFVERLDLITWLEGASEESEYIKPLAGEKEAGAAGAAAAVALKGASAPVTAAARSGRGTLDPRLAVIYNGERKMGDRNTVLRGSKPINFSEYRKQAALFMVKKPQHPSSSSISNNPSLASHQKNRRPEPIILLSPSASSLLRLSNIKSFLEGGRYIPPDGSLSNANMLAITRIVKEIDQTRPMRFILVEGPEQFKPDYWNRVVAVFTTGQTWQFKNYKWSSANELFKHTMGIYVGWRGDQPPDAVRSWGHRVLSCQLDRWRDPNAPGADTSRWRDREVMESIWKAIENNMRAKGWKRDSGPASI